MNVRPRIEGEGFALFSKTSVIRFCQCVPGSTPQIQFPKCKRKSQLKDWSTYYIPHAGLKTEKCQFYLFVSKFLFTWLTFLKDFLYWEHCKCFFEDVFIVVLLKKKRGCISSSLLASLFGLHPNSLEKKLLLQN